MDKKQTSFIGKKLHSEKITSLNEHLGGGSNKFACR